MEAHGRSRALRLGIAIVLVAASLALIAYTPARVSAATVVCGTISGPTTWTAAGNPYYVTCDVTVEQNASLAIQAGVTVLVTPGSHFWVDGILVVSGTAANPVVFDSNASTPAMNDWSGLFLGQATYAQLTGLVVRHGNLGLLAMASGPTGQGILVRDSEFAFNLYGMMVGMVPGTTGPYLQRVYVHDNDEGIVANSTLYVVDSVVEGNFRDGIRAGVGPLYLTNTTVSLNGDAGIELWADTRNPPPNPHSVLMCNNVRANGIGVDVVAGNPIYDAGADVATVYRNNFVNNTVQARDTTASSWDNGTAGNYWNNYTGTDRDGDGFGDTPYVIDADSQDRHPYMAPVPGCPGGGPQPMDDPPGPATVRDAQLTGNRLRDVTLGWDLSRDDGAGEKDVAAYLLYTSTAFDSRGAGYSLLATLAPGTTTYTDAGAGVGDAGNHFYRLVVRDAAGQMTPSGDQFAKHTHALAAGQHLLSIPIRVSDTRIDVVLQTIQWDRARTYVNPSGQGKNWLSNDKAKPWADLTDVQQGMALWLLVSRASDLVVAGVVPASVVVPLEIGWNFVGYSSFVDRTVAEALAGAKLQPVEGFDAANSPFYLRRLADTDVLHAGDGLWVHVSEAHDWTLTN